MNTPNESIPAEILVVDDTPANLQLLSGILKECGYKVRLAISGELALQSARHSPPDLILLDITMPGFSGYEVASELRRDTALSKIPIIFISALTEMLDKVRAFAVGGVDYVTKPFHYEEVAARVKTHLKIRQLQMELEGRNHQLQQSNDELHHLQELRDNLVSMIVHDMNSPLSAMMMSIELLESSSQKNLSANDSRFLSTASDACRNLAGMVRSLLDVSKMEAGALDLHRTDCDLAVIAREVLAGFESLRKNRRFEIDPTQQPFMVSVDRDLISRVLQNLVGNALKYAPDNSLVQITLESTKTMIRVSVIDTGQGIPLEHHERIFEKFGQVQREGPRVGTGLGLTFCRLAVEAHGGRIGVKSEVGKGSTFWFEVPSKSQ
jgi:two-component system sensor histidine kinase/response regulator